MICNKCGSEISDDSNVCPVCGNDITTEKKIKPPVLTGELWMAISILSILVVLLAGILFLVIVHGVKNRKETAQNSLNSSVGIEHNGIEENANATEEMTDEGTESEELLAEESTNEKITEEKTTEATERYTTEETTTVSVSSDEDTVLSVTDDSKKAFYGIWCCGYESENDAIKFAEEMRSKGFDAECLRTTDWSNLNVKLFYVVTAGRYETEADAQCALSSVTGYSEYSDAYIKYSGDYIGQ